MKYIFTYKVERIERSFAEVELEVSEADLDTLNHSELEQKAILQTAGTFVWHTNVAHRADLMRREEIRYATEHLLVADGWRID